MAIMAHDKFVFDGTGDSFDGQQPTQFAPHAWLATPLTSTISAGVGVWAPYGLATSWSTDFEGRYFGWDNTLRAIYIQPTIAAALMNGRLALGAGLVAVNGFVELNQRIDLARTIIPGTSLRFNAIGVPDGTDFANADLKVDDWAATFHAGVQFQASDRWSFGARYLHSAKLDLSGAARFQQIATGILLPAGNPFGLPAGTPLDALLATQFRQGGPLGDQRLTTELTMPSQVVAGASFAATSDFKLLLDYQWTRWNQWDEAVLHFGTAPTDTLLLDFHDASTFRIAAQYTHRDELTFRAGILHNRDAAPDVTVTPLLPEAPRTSFAAGLGYLITERFSADAGNEYLHQDERRGSVRPRENRAQTAAVVNVGSYTAHAVFAGITLSYRFGKRTAVEDQSVER
jgi:long-chain fatty acid transport protein